MNSVTDRDLPFSGQMAQVVQPNAKCAGCMHYDQMRGRHPVCEIGLKPTNCGSGEHPSTGYWPIANLTLDADAEDEPNPIAQAPYRRTQMVAAHVVGDVTLQDTQRQGPTLPGGAMQIEVLGDEYAPLVKSVLSRTENMAKASCDAHRRPLSGHGQHFRLPIVNYMPRCTCRPVTVRDVTKALRESLPNGMRASIPDNVLLHTIWLATGRLVKAATGKGEGSRGGTVIGHTKSGKPIYSAQGRDVQSFERSKQSESLKAIGHTLGLLRATIS